VGLAAFTMGAGQDQLALSTMQSPGMSESGQPRR